ncbi:MAG: hypothetical protein EOQ93_29265 [Mesorhizobium sp.]|nr:MAG: hypothetical protein EOQ93_29265 [Mesorhizobium sp.]
MAIDTTPTTPTTLLEAVNILLESARVAGVDSLAQVDLNEDAAAAKQALDDVSREVQRVGWEQNTSRGYVLDPEVDGTINLPNDTAKVKISRGYSGNRLVPRNGKLYDPKLRTFNIGKSVTVDLVQYLEFSDLTDTMKAYITAMAARRFAIPRLPSASAFKYTEEMVEGFLVALEQEDTDHDDRDISEVSPHFAKFKRGKRR